jgi:hypothetical protein
LLLAPRTLVRVKTADRLEPVHWAHLTDGSPIRDCQVLGLPDAQQLPAHGLDMAHLECGLRPGTGVTRSRYVLDVKDLRPEAEKAKGSPWEGMSGAVLFAEGMVLGIITAAPPHWGHRRLDAIKGMDLDVRSPSWGPQGRPSRLGHHAG